jgi:alpha-L-fucosidase 2
MVKLDRITDGDCEIEFSGRSSGQEDCELEMRGIFNTGVEFAVTAKVTAKGLTAVVGNMITIKGGHRAVILLNIKTNTADYDADTGFIESDFESLLSRHIKNWQKAYNNCAIEIKLEDIEKYTDERLEALKSGADFTLPVLYFNFGRYLMLASAGNLPPQLQGIWSERLNPPWDCDFHLDINIQMNYWASEACGLSETTEPLFAFTERLIPTAKTAAKELYGCRGVCYPIQTDAWSISTPEAKGWAVWIGAAAWLALHFMEHYEYTGDLDFLKNRAYPYFKECAEFYEDYLFPGDDGKYVIAPSQSPENRIKNGGEPVSILYNCSSDIELCEMALSFAVKSAEILNIDAEKAELWKSLIEKLPEIKIGPEGELMEFPENFELPEPGHRHLSHLIGVFPGSIITAGKRPEQFKAAKRALELARIGRTVVGRHPHADQKHLAARLLRGADDCGEVVAHLCDRQPAQAVVGAELDDGDLRVLAREHAGDA